MTTRDLRNMHTTRNSCRDALPCMNMADGIFTCWWRSLLVTTSKFGLLTIRRHTQCNQNAPTPVNWSLWVRSEKAKKRTNINTSHSYHQCSSHYVSLADLTIRSDSVLTNPIWAQKFRCLNRFISLPSTLDRSLGGS